jgi:hypothetical protein
MSTAAVVPVGENESDGLFVSGSAGLAGPAAQEVRQLTDDEILDLGTRVRARKQDGKALLAANDQSASGVSRELSQTDVAAEGHDSSEGVRAYQEAFETPELAREAKARLAHVERIDGLFFSRRPEDHADLARLVAGLDPESFSLLAKAMNDLAASDERGEVTKQSVPEADRGIRASQSITPPEQFVFEANGAAVKAIVNAVETQVDKILPDGISATARNRVVGEVYREVDAFFSSNDELKTQVRMAMRSGSFDAKHRDAIASLIASRARQVLPGATKKVMTEWTSTLTASQRNRQARQAAAENRVDIAGSRGAAVERGRAQSPRDIDYRRMSDVDILNL